MIKLHEELLTPRARRPDERRPGPPGHREALDNILRVLAIATEEERAAGMAWYASAHARCAGIARRHGLTIAQASGIVAVLSPKTEWSANLRMAEDVCAGRPVAGLGASIRKASRILHGEDVESVLAAPKGQPRSGQKVRAFFSNISDPLGSNDVTIDRHAYDVAVGTVGDNAARKALERSGVYEATADAYRAAAATAGVCPHQAQAITWAAWKRTKVYKRPQHAALYQAA